MLKSIVAENGRTVAYDEKGRAICTWNREVSDEEIDVYFEGINGKEVHFHTPRLSDLPRGAHILRH